MVEAVKGGCNPAISYSNTPSDQMSDLELQPSVFIISGDRQQGVPTTVLAIDLVSERTLDRPKSPSLRMPRFVTKMFADFRSRCKIFLSWACLRARQIYVNQFKTTSSEKYFLSSRCALIFENRSPSSQCSITMQSLPFFVLYTSRNRVMFG